MEELHLNMRLCVYMRSSSVTDCYQLRRQAGIATETFLLMHKMSLAVQHGNVARNLCVEKERQQHFRSRKSLVDRKKFKWIG